MWKIVLPKTIVSVIIIKEHCSSAEFFIINPISCVFSLKLTLFVFYPKSSLSIPFIIFPSSLSKLWCTVRNCYLVFVTVRVDLNSETRFLIHFPISNISHTCHPFFSFNRAIFVFFLMFDPVNCSMSAILLGFFIISYEQ